MLWLWCLVPVPLMALLKSQYNILIHTVSQLCVITYSSMHCVIFYNTLLILACTSPSSLKTSLVPRSVSLSTRCTLSLSPLSLFLYDIHLCRFSPGRWLDVNPSCVWVWSLPPHRGHDPLGINLHPSHELTHMPAHTRCSSSARQAFQRVVHSAFSSPHTDFLLTSLSYHPSPVISTLSSLLLRTPVLF